MRILGAVAATALLTVQAYAQEMPHINLIPELQSKSAEEKEAETERDKAYKESLRKIPDNKASSDPWGTMREAPKSAAPAKRAKSGSSN
jgi:hypothetical protein